MLTDKDLCRRAKGHRNLILIGMPGAGKTTIGHLLADWLGWPLLDTDRMVEVRQQGQLQSLIDTRGVERFLAAEQSSIESLDCEQTVIATGGSVIYGEKGMKNLQRLGPLIWIDVPLSALKERIHNMNQRGIASTAGIAFDDLYQQRTPLYRQWSDLRIPAGRTAEETARSILQLLAKPPASRKKDSP